MLEIFYSRLLLIFELYVLFVMKKFRNFYHLKHISLFLCILWILRSFLEQKALPSNFKNESPVNYVNWEQYFTKIAIKIAVLKIWREKKRISCTSDSFEIFYLLFMIHDMDLTLFFSNEESFAPLPFFWKSPSFFSTDLKCHFIIN